MGKYTHFEGSGVYVPMLIGRSVVFALNLDHDPLCGVQIDTPENAQRFSNVVVLDEHGNQVKYLAAQSAEMAA